MRGKPARIPSRSSVRTGPWGAATGGASLHSPGVLSFTYNPETSSVTQSSSNAREVLGVSQQHLSVHGALFLAYVHPADRFNTEVLLDTALRDGVPYIATYRWIRPDSNEIRFIHCRANTDQTTNLFRGIIVDITPETAKLRAGGDLALAVGDLLQHVELPGFTFDLELTIRSINPSLKNYPLSFGVTDFQHDKLAPGVSLLDCFGSEASRRAVHDALEGLSGAHQRELKFSVDGFQTVIRPLISDGCAHGFVIVVVDRREEENARAHAAILESELQKSDAIRTYRPAIAAATQEIAGYSALITRHARGHPLLAAISDSLIQSIRELALTTDQLSNPTATPLTKSRGMRVKKRSTTPQTLRRTSNAHVVFASELPRCATSHALMLREAGVSCAAAELDESHLLSVTRSSPTIKVIVIDAPTQERKLCPLLRRLKRESPRVHLVCLATNDDEVHTALLRAGAVRVLSKPAPGREIERAVRALIEL